MFSFFETRYNTRLFTLVGQNEWGHAVPLSFIMTSHGKAEILEVYCFCLNYKNNDGD
jgi:hypothetical protein